MAPAWATPATVWVTQPWPAFTSWGLEVYHEEAAAYVVGPTTKRWLVSRAGLVEQATDPDLQWWQGVGYRLDYGEGPSDTVIGGLGGIGDMVDPSRAALAPDLYNTLLERVHDVDGDGTVDLLVSPEEILLTSFDDPRVVPLPPSSLPTIGYMGYPVAVPDLDGDGHAELFDSNPDYGPGVAQTSSLTVFDGGPDGYDPLARWRLTAEGGSVDAVAVQADGDDELELVVLMADIDLGYPFSMDLVNARTLLIDDAATATPIVVETPGRIGYLTWGASHPARTPFLHNLGDLDSDGFDEVLVTMWERPWKGDSVELQILSSAASYDVDQPLASFNLGPDKPIPGSSGLRALVADVDADGDLDIVAVQEANSPTIQVWFGPLYEPPPEPTGLTGDTGAPPDTASTAGPATATATTPTSSTTADTGVASGAAPSAKPPASSCGCVSRPMGSLWVPWGAAALVGLRRRPRGRSSR